MHSRIVSLAQRPFIDVNEMNRTLIDNWNSVVSKNDVVYHLGDVGFFATAQQCYEVMSKLNGTIYLVIGNHDGFKIVKDSGCFPKIYQYHSIVDRGVDICLFHYPIFEWNKKHHGSYHLYGHVHGRDLKAEGLVGRAYDVGVDTNGFTPLTIDRIHDIMTTKPVVKPWE